VGSRVVAAKATITTGITPSQETASTAANRLQDNAA
jgi:hypothetical protein